MDISLEIYNGVTKACQIFWGKKNLCDQDIDDIIQECLLSYVKNKEKMDLLPHFPYKMLAQYRGYDYLRKIHSREDPFGSKEHFVDEDISDIENNFEKRSLIPGITNDPTLNMEIEDLLKNLPENMKDILLLYYCEGYTEKEIGNKYNLCESSINQIKHKAIKLIRHNNEIQSLRSPKSIKKIISPAKKIHRPKLIKKIDEYIIIRCSGCSKSKIKSDFIENINGVDKQYKMCHACRERGRIKSKKFQQKYKSQDKPLMTTKICPLCKNAKIISCFMIDNTRKDGYEVYCWQCKYKKYNAENAKKRWKKDKERMLRVNERWCDRLEINLKWGNHPYELSDEETYDISKLVFFWTKRTGIENFDIFNKIVYEAQLYLKSKKSRGQYLRYSTFIKHRCVQYMRKIERGDISNQHYYSQKQIQAS